MDVDLPGPRAPVLVQSLQWLLLPPFRWAERLSARYGDTFEVRLMGPSCTMDRTWRALVPRTIVVLSRPSHLRELFDRSRDEFLTGQAYEFLGWHTGHDSIMQLDGASHRQERRQMQSMIHHPGILTLYERLTREAFRRALASWPDEGSVALQSSIARAVMDAGLLCIFGNLSEGRLALLRDLVRSGAAANAVPWPLGLLPFLRRDLGRWSPGARIKRAIAGFDQFVAQELVRRDDSLPSREAARMLDTFEESGAPPSDSAEWMALIARRMRLVVAGSRVIEASAAWLCYRVVRDPELRERVREASEREGEERSTAYLEAVCRESLRMNQPFRGAFRRVSADTTLDGFRLREGTLLLPLYSLTHRRPDLYPEPDRFRPDRFLERSFSPEEFVPFGGGVRRSLGEPLVLLQLRLLLVELVRAFELRPAGAWSDAEQRRKALIAPRDPLNAVVRRRAKL